MSWTDAVLDAVAIVIVLACCFSSDLTRERPKHIAAMALLSVVSLSIVAGLQSNAHVRYAFLCFGEYGRANVHAVRLTVMQVLLVSGPAVL